MMMTLVTVIVTNNNMNIRTKNNNFRQKSLGYHRDFSLFEKLQNGVQDDQPLSSQSLTPFDDDDACHRRRYKQQHEDKSERNNNCLALKQ